MRSKVSRAQSDIRSLATAIEAYCVDQNSYPVAKDAMNDGNAGNDSNGNATGKAPNDSLVGVNWALVDQSSSVDNGSKRRCTFVVSYGKASIQTLTKIGRAHV